MVGAVKQLMTANGPSEMLAMLRYARTASRARSVMTAALDPDWRYAYDALCNVSRSFAVVIMQLNVDIRHPVCVFYLVLRALDTVEDDTKIDASERQRLCRDFWKFLPVSSSDNVDVDVDVDVQPCPQPWSSSRFGKGAEKELCQRFQQVVACFRTLKPVHQRIIADITRRMGAGMADHIHDTKCETTQEYDQYCHYVAGLVGYGLTDIFVQADRERPFMSERLHLSNSMGIFLQKTNIIRDYLEDLHDARSFWPRDIWGQYGDNLEEFSDIANRKFALAALNHMVTDALRHVHDCVEYMSMITSTDVFNFVAIPQVMAMATLAECYNNGLVFEGVVKLRRARTALLMQRTSDMDGVYRLFFEHAHMMLQKIEAHDPNARGTRKVLNSIVDVCVPHVPAAPNLIIPNLVSIVLFCGLSSYVLRRRQEHFDGAVFTWRSAGGIMEVKDMLAVGALFLVCMYMFAFFLLPYMTKIQQEEVRRLHRERVECGDGGAQHEYEREVVELTEDGTEM